MNKDYKVWNINMMLESYSDYPDMAKAVNSKMESLFLFLENNQLLNCKISNSEGQVVKRFIMKSELTEEGNRLASGPKNPVHRWLGSKGSQAAPPDMRILEKSLTEIRARP